MIEALVEEARRVTVGYMQCGEPSPPLEWIMHPKTFADLRIEAARTADGLVAFFQQRADGEFEFMHHPIREDVFQNGWQLRPVKNSEGQGDD